MKLRKPFDPYTDKTITMQAEEDEDMPAGRPEYGDVISMDDEVDLRLGKTLYDKYGVKTFEVIEVRVNVKVPNKIYDDIISLTKR